MNPDQISPAATPAPRRRRIWPWVLGFCLTPFFTLGAVAFSVLTLDRDAATLRREVMRATDSGWNTKVQLSFGRLTLGAVRTVLYFIRAEHMEDARDALASVKHASVGVYELEGDRTEWSREQIFAKTDRAMQSRGWTRLIGVADGSDTALVYTSADPDQSDAMPLCLAVVNGRELVVVSTVIDADGLANIVARHAGEGFGHKLRIARR